jgi:hypothetical protein
MFELKEPQKFETRDASGKTSVQILVATEGCGMVGSGRQRSVMLAKG